LSAGLCGCGTRIKPIPVSGIITEEGKPLKDARVTFNPVASGGRIAFGQTDEQGRFKLTTFNHNDGALPGQYKVTVSVTGPTRPADIKVATDRKEMMREMERLKNLKAPQVHTNYTRLDKSPLVAEVPADGEIKIELKRDGT
jgi:hypothetical protein